VVWRKRILVQKSTGCEKTNPLRRGRGNSSVLEQSGMQERKKGECVSYFEKSHHECKNWMGGNKSFGKRGNE